MKNTTEEIQALIHRKALFIVNHSGGKDSQAMFIKVRALVPRAQIHVIHAHLSGVEWEGVIEHIFETCEGFSTQVVKANKTLFEMARHRQKWPSPKYRQCTSDLKRGPIEKAIRHELKKRGLFLVVNCMGLRAEESSNRAKKEVFKYNLRNSKAGREWYDWLPIHDYVVDRVFSTIEDVGETPHWAYEAGMTRLSCCFCIMASKRDLRTAAMLYPELYAEYVALEKEIGHTLMMPSKGIALGLESITGIQCSA
ncbi:MAG: phosphoadenosine phosphosulfate reductase family protein [Gammaproteobacteria bacterium]|nr:phosphoadenosine phosphosulfate reductase family protein [Gammaproteobacteria bacterium]